MSDARAAGVVVDTMVISWLFDDRPNTLAESYRELIGSEPVVLAFQTVMELRFGALRAGSGRAATPTPRTPHRRDCRRPTRQRDDHDLRRAPLAMPAGRSRTGRHDGDRWIAATAIRLGVPLASHDRLFNGAPGLRLITANTR